MVAVGTGEIMGFGPTRRDGRFLLKCSRGLDVGPGPLVEVAVSALFDWASVDLAGVTLEIGVADVVLVSLQNLW